MIFVSTVDMFKPDFYLIQWINNGPVQVDVTAVWKVDPKRNLFVLFNPE